MVDVAAADKNRRAAEDMEEKDKLERLTKLQRLHSPVATTTEAPPTTSPEVPDFPPMAKGNAGIGGAGSSHDALMLATSKLTERIDSISTKSDSIETKMDSMVSKTDLRNMQTY